MEKDLAPDFIADEDVPQDQPQNSPMPSALPAPQNQDWQGSYGVSQPDFIPDEQAPKDSAPDFISDEDAKASDKYTSPLEHAGMLAENFVKGAAPVVGQSLEDTLSDIGVPGLSREDQEKRSEAYPIQSKVAKAAGNIALTTALPEANIASLGKIGSAALNGLWQMGGIQAADEVSNYLMGKGNAPSAAAWNIAKAGGLGLLGGATLPILGKVGGTLANKYGYGVKGADSLMSSFLTGVGHAAQFPAEATVKLGESALNDAERKMVDPGMFKVGQDAYKQIIKAPLAQAAGHAGHVAINTLLPGHENSSMAASLIFPYIALKLENNLLKYIPKGFNDKVSAAFLNMARSGRAQGVDQVLNSAVNMAKGDALLGRSVKSLFKLAPKEYLDFTSDIRERNKLKDAVNEPDQMPNPTPVPQGFADGGEVQSQGSNPMAELYPDLQMQMSTAQGRVKGYLKSLRPDEQKTRLPYDLNQPNPQAHHDYDRVIGLAVKPLSILKRVQNGSLTPKDMTHFTSLYPELHQELSQRIHQQIAENRIKDHPKPEYKMRQALSLFLGQDLDSSLTQPAIALAQSVFAPKQAPQPQAKNSKDSLSKLGQNAMTSDQSRQERSNKA